MKNDKKLSVIALIVGEFVLGIALSLLYFRVVLTNEVFFGNSYFSGIIRLYGVLSIIFFISVFSVGIIGAIKFHQSNKISQAISYSVLFWLLSLILYTMMGRYLSYTFNLRIIPMYIILVGIIFGFNLGLKLKVKTESSNH